MFDRKAYKRAYREANKEKILAGSKAFREANKEKISAGMKAYREANKEKISAGMKAYREANKKKILAYNKSIVENLPDFYLRCELRKKHSIRHVPVELIEAERIIIGSKRLIIKKKKDEHVKTS